MPLRTFLLPSCYFARFTQSDQVPSIVGESPNSVAAEYHRLGPDHRVRRDAFVPVFVRHRFDGLGQERNHAHRVGDLAL
jgi:hypothetical protein